jgi:uncharacterized coiled-coil DUF342 family protein
MNKDRRKAIDALLERIEQLKTDIDALASEIETIKDEEQDYYDNMPESFQDGDKGQRAQEAIDALDNAQQTLEGFDCDDVISSLQTASE